MDYPVKKVVMTGGSGPVGLALIRKMLAEDVEILLFQRKDSLKSMYLPEHDLLHIEYCRLEELKNYQPSSSDYDVFFHMGWDYTDACYRNDLKKHSTNVRYTCDAVELSHRMGCHTFVGVGSQAEYGRYEGVLREDTCCQPENAYGVMKLTACHAARLLCEQLNIRYMWTRITSAYGIFDNIYSVIVSTILNALDGRELCFSKCEQIWDFVYVDDVANALYLMALRGRDGVIYPLGGGKARPLKKDISILCEKLGKADEMQFGKIPYRRGQVMHLEADISALQKDTGWVPEVDFEDGIDLCIEFYKRWKLEWEERFKKKEAELS